MHKPITCLLSALLGAALWTSALPTPIQAASAPVIIPGDLAVLTDIQITDVDSPKAGEPFDTTATATAKNGKSWTVTVFWMDKQEMSEEGLKETDSTKPLIASDGSSWVFKTYEAVDKNSDSPSASAAFSVKTTDGTTGTYSLYPIQIGNEEAALAEDGKTYMPLIMFYLEDGYTCDGTVTLDEYLQGVFEETGGILSIPDTDSGITYITGTIVKKNALETRPEELPPLNPTMIPASSGTAS
ncbi:MAG: hypothetical protein Q4A32_05460 [Lachnospiraceae bacterium]|nr:hypothetical protein [Lachnospiraceae bacterium]